MAKFVFELSGFDGVSEFEIPEGVSEEELQDYQNYVSVGRGRQRTGSGLALLHFEALELG